MAFLYPLLGAAVALAGGDKLAGNRDYAGMFRHLGWSRGAMQAAAAAEVVGGLLMVPRTTRRIGSALAVASSTAVLTSEIRAGDTKLAAPRGLLLLACLAAFIAPD